MTDTLWSGPFLGLTGTNAGSGVYGGNDEIMGDSGRAHPGGSQGLLASPFTLSSNRMAVGAPAPQSRCHEALSLNFPIKRMCPLEQRAVHK